MNIQSYRASVRTTKRSAILAAAAQAFSANGFSGAGMADIARRADVSTATLYKHFESKEELFSELAVSHIEPFHARAEQTMPTAQISEDPVQALVDLSGSFAELLRNEQTLDLFRLIIAEGDRFPELKEIIYRHGRDPFKIRLTQILEGFHERGILCVHEASSAAEFYIGMLSYWLLFAPIFNADIKFSPDQIDHIIRENALMFLARFDASGGDIVGQGDTGPSLRNGTSPKLTPYMDGLGGGISA